MTHKRESQTLPETICKGGLVMGMHVVLVGNPVDGIEVYGPFNTYDHAAAWTDDEARSHLETWIVPLHGEDEI